MYLVHVMYISMYTVLMYRKQQRNVAYNLIYAHEGSRDTVCITGAPECICTLVSAFPICAPPRSVLRIDREKIQGGVDVELHREIVSRVLCIWIRVYARIIAILA